MHHWQLRHGRPNDRPAVDMPLYVHVCITLKKEKKNTNQERMKRHCIRNTHTHTRSNVCNNSNNNNIFYCNEVARVGIETRQTLHSARAMHAHKTQTQQTTTRHIQVQVNAIRAYTIHVYGAFSILSRNEI